MSGSRRRRDACPSGAGPSSSSKTAWPSSILQGSSTKCSIVSITVNCRTTSRWRGEGRDATGLVLSGDRGSLATGVCRQTFRQQYRQQAWSTILIMRLQQRRAEEACSLRYVPPEVGGVRHFWEQTWMAVRVLGIEKYLGVDTGRTGA
eukprot:6354940-Pyramimonas_sp.AAC.1